MDDVRKKKQNLETSWLQTREKVFLYKYRGDIFNCLKLVKDLADLRRWKGNKQWIQVCKVTDMGENNEIKEL